MNKDEALIFLRNHQPMPDDSLLDKSTISVYDEVRRYFLNNPDKECLPLFLNSFGDYDGFGVYQLVEDVVLKFEYEEVVNCLLEALNSKYNGVKYWCAQICSLYPDERLIVSLERLLNDHNEDIKMSAITALSQIQSKKVLYILKKQLVIEGEKMIIDFISEVISDIEGK